MYPTEIYKITVADEKIIRATPTIRISCPPSIKKKSPNIKVKNKTTEIYAITCLNLFRFCSDIFSSGIPAYVTFK